MNWREEISSGDVILRPIASDDAYRIIEFAGDEAITSKFNFFREPITLERELGYIEKIKRSSNDIIFAIERIQRRDLFSEESLPSFEFVGTIGLHEIDWACKSARLGVIIWDKKYRGKGYRTKALKILIDYFFGEDILCKIYVNLFKDNCKEIDFYQREFKFKFKAALKNHYRLGGECLDMTTLSLTKKAS